MGPRMRKFVGVALWWIHFVIVLFVIFAPFSGYASILLADLISIPLIKLHWMTNSNRCFLTTLSDDFLSDFKPKSNSGFIGELFEKLFNLKLTPMKSDQITHWLMLGLWFICLYNYGSSV